MLESLLKVNSEQRPASEQKRRSMIGCHATHLNLSEHQLSLA